MLMGWGSCQDLFCWQRNAKSLRTAVTQNRRAVNYLSIMWPSLTLLPASATPTRVPNGPVGSKYQPCVYFKLGQNILHACSLCIAD